MLVARGRNLKTCSGSNFGSRIIEAPASRIVLVATKRPWVWKIGKACSSTSSLVKRQ
ncbi:hypothetical protein D3C72_2523690 [compost metagenome]